MAIALTGRKKVMRGGRVPEEGRRWIRTEIFPVTTQQHTHRAYERHPYPSADLAKIVAAGGQLPPRKWLEAIGRPGQRAPRRVLVAGCGTGVEAFALRKWWPEAEIVALDFSPRSITVARKVQRAAPGARPIDFRVADLTDAKLAQQVGGDFDLITCHGVLSYIPEPQRVFANLATCVAPGGALYLGVNGDGHPASRLRPWLTGFGVEVDELRDERRLRELLGLWDALNDDGDGELATMGTSYLASDVCGPFFNNWPLARWRAVANEAGWEIAGTDILPLALQLAAERGHHGVLFPVACGELAARLDQARPAGFHRMVLRRAAAGELDVVGSVARKPAVCWTGLFSVRFSKAKRPGEELVVMRCAVFRLRLEWAVPAAQAAALRALIAAGRAGAPAGWWKAWPRNDAARRTLWLLSGMGAVAVAATNG